MKAVFFTRRKPTCSLQTSKQRFPQKKTFGPWRCLMVMARSSEKFKCSLGRRFYIQPPRKKPQKWLHLGTNQWLLMMHFYTFHQRILQKRSCPKLCCALQSLAKGLTVSVALMVNPKIKPIPGLFKSFWYHRRVERSTKTEAFGKMEI